MTHDGLLVLQCLFGSIWRLFTSWHIPGTETTPAAFFMFIAVCGLALKFLYRVSGVVPDAGIITASVEKIPPLQTGGVPARKD